MNSKSEKGVIIVPLADGPAHAVALPVARRLARLEEATLRILLISDPGTSTEEGLARLGLDQDDLYGAILARATGPVVPTALEMAERWPESTIVIALSAVAPAETVSKPGPGRASGPALEPTPWPQDMQAPAPETTPESASEATPESASEAAPGRPHPSDLPLGRDLEELITGAPGPLVLVPPLEDARAWNLKRLLVPHDGTPTTGHVVGPAATLAASAGAELVILHVASTGAVPPSEPGTMTTPLYIDQPQHEWPAWTREFEDRLSVMIPTETVPSRTILATGDPGHEIVRHTADLEVDLVVLGWHGDPAGSRAATLKTVIREAEAPLMILRVGQRVAR